MRSDPKYRSDEFSSSSDPHVFKFSKPKVLRLEASQTHIIRFEA